MGVSVQVFEQTGFFAKIMSNGPLSVIVTVLATILLFGVLILIHELGHYLTARLFKVTVKEFSIGMGPKIWSKKSEKTQFSELFERVKRGYFIVIPGKHNFFYTKIFRSTFNLIFV